MRRIALIPFALALLSHTPLFATEEKDDICAALDNASDKVKKLYEGWAREDACRAEYWSSFQAKPASELLNAENYTAYAAALDRQDCDTPLALLANAFAAAYPQAPNILTRGDHFKAWKSRVLDYQYPEPDLYLTVRRILEAQAEIERRGIRAERYKDGRQSILPGDLPIVVGNRNIAVFSLMGLKHYPPALLALARLSHEGEIIRFVPEFQYFLLQTLLLRGIEREQLADMLVVTTEKLTPSQMESLERQARAGKHTGPQPTTE